MLPLSFKFWSFALGFTLALCPGFPRPAFAEELLIGAATREITPDRPVALLGQMETRISEGAETPLTVTALALESRGDDRSFDQAVLVSCDLTQIPAEALAKTRARVKRRLPHFPLNKISMSATHTHTAPVLIEGEYHIPQKGVMGPAAYLDFFADRAADAVVRAWDARKPGKVGWGLGHAVVAQNRRAVSAGGNAVMYGATHSPNFRMLEGYEDHAMDVLFFWDADERLIATALNLACPAQEVENRTRLNADFWGPVREALRAKHGENLHVLGWCGAAGDQSPHLMLNKRAEERMRKLRGLGRVEEIARRIVAAWDDAYEGARQEMHADAPFVHEVETLELPRRIVTEQEGRAAQAKVDQLASQPDALRRLRWHEEVVKRYERQQAGLVEPYVMELHAIRLGDVAIVTNDFELFTDFGIQLKARSPALQTFVVQLSGPGTYIPSARAEQGGGYSAIVESNEVGSEAGQILVDRTIARLQTLWPAAPEPRHTPDLTQKSSRLTP